MHMLGDILEYARDPIIDKFRKDHTVIFGDLLLHKRVTNFLSSLFKNWAWVKVGMLQDQYD